MPTRTQIEDVLIEKFTRDYRPNPKWDRKKAKANDWEDDPNNLEFIPATRQERMNETPFQKFIAEDGYPALRSLTFKEIVDALEEAGILDR